jgi:tRNA G46 methylase TrmB
MDKEIVNILKKYGCAFMETDNKEMLEEIVAFAKEQGKAINYSQCCTELKGKEALTFKEWKRGFIVEEKNDRFWHISDVRLSFTEMEQKYKDYLQNL